jgi:MFS family permease
MRRASETNEKTREPRPQEGGAETPASDLKPYFLRNYLAHGIEGGLAGGGLAFISLQTVLPKMVETLGGPKRLIAFLPFLQMVGMSVVPVLVIHVIERLHRMKPYVLLMGALQRLPFLVAGLVLLGLDRASPAALAAVVGAPFVSGIFGGAVLAAWLEMTARVLPHHRIPSLMAIRMVLQALLGLAAGVIIERVLTVHADRITLGYGILFLISFGLYLLSWLTLSLIHEPRATDQETRPRAGLFTALQAVPVLFRTYPRLRRYLAARLAAAGQFILAPFLAIHALNVLDKPESFLGPLVVSQMLGGIAGNLVGGPLGDRFGARLPSMLGRAGNLLTCVAVVLARTETAFLLVFVLRGFAQTTQRLGDFALNIAVAPREKRPSFFTTMQIAWMPAMLFCSATGAVITEHTSDILPLAAATGVLLVVSLIALSRTEVPAARRVAG